jgi:branched-chain amino acid transport system substrate-binding protein
MHIRQKSRLCLAAGCAAMTAIAASACGSGSGSPSGAGTTHAPFNLGYIGSTTPLVTGFEDLRAGTEAYMDSINAVGGVDGRKVNLIFKDDVDLNTEAEVAFYDELTQQSHVLMIAGLTIDSSIPVITAKGEADHVPIILEGGVERSQVFPLQRYIYGTNPTFRTVAEGGAGAAARAGNKKVAMLYIESSESIDAVTYAQKNFASKFGVDLVSAQYLPLTATDYTAQVQAAKQAGAQAILAEASPQGLLIIAKDMKALGYEVPVYAQTPDTQIFSSLGSEGAQYIATDIYDANPSAPGYKAASAAAAKYGYSSVLAVDSGSFIQGWVDGEVYVKALQICGANCSSPTQYNAALQKIHDLQTGGLSAPLSFSATDHQLGSVTFSWTMHDGHVVTGAAVSTTP